MILKEYFGSRYTVLGQCVSCKSKKVVDLYSATSKGKEVVVFLLCDSCADFVLENAGHDFFDGPLCLSSLDISQKNKPRGGM